MRHATALLYHVCAVASRDIRFASCGTSGKLTLWTRYLGFEVLKAVVKNVAIFWDVALYSPNVNRRFGGTYRLHHQGKKSAEQETSVQQVARPCAMSQRMSTFKQAFQ
jgi:hypothetical protein